MRQSFAELGIGLGLEILRTHRALTYRRQYIIANQLLRSGTSVGANLHEALGTVSTADLLHKVSIAYKEVRETVYWLTLIERVKLLPSSQIQGKEQAIELAKLLSKSVQTLKRKKYGKPLSEK